MIVPTWTFHECQSLKSHATFIILGENNNLIDDFESSIDNDFECSIHRQKI